MSRTIPFVAALLSPFEWTHIARAQVPAEITADDWKIHVELHAITMPEKKAFALLPKLRDEKQIEEAWKTIQAMLEKDEAKIVASPSTSTTHGQRIELKEGEEVKYGVQFDAPQIIEASGEIAKATNAAVSEKPRPVGYAISTFEVRNVGIQFEAHVEVSDDGKRLMFDAQSGHTRLLKWDEFEVGRLANNEKIIVKQPRFHVATSKTQFGIFAGERVLLGSHRVPDKPGEMEVLVLRAWTTPRKEAR